MFKFNLLELSYNNTIQLRFKHVEGGVALNVRTVVSSDDDLDLGLTLSVGDGSTTVPTPQLVKDIAAAFPFTAFENTDGPCCHADFIRVTDSNRGGIRYDVTEYVYKNQTEVVKSSRRQPVVVDCLEDITQHPEKVQKFASIVFTPKVKAAYIASLPRVEVENEDTRQKTVELPVMVDNPDYDPEVEGSQKQVQATETVDESYEASEVLDGAVLRQVPAGVRQVEKPLTETVGVTDEAGNPVMEEYKTGEFTTFIEYKGEQYPEGWNGEIA